MTTTQYSLKEFYNRTMELAKTAGKDYIDVAVNMKNSGEVEFRCYVAGFDYQRGKTPDEALINMRNKMFPVDTPAKENDVIIEVAAQENLS